MPNTTTRYMTRRGRHNVASPQVENGHIRIAHGLYREALKQLTSGEFKVWAAIVDFTYGWNKKRDRISHGQLAEATGLSRSEVVRTVARLQKRHVIVVEGTPGAVGTISPNKDYDTWLTCSKSAQVEKQPVAKADRNLSQKRTGTCSKSAHTRSMENHVEPCTVAKATGAQAFIAFWIDTSKEHYQGPCPDSPPRVGKFYKEKQKAGYTDDDLRERVRRFFTEADSWLDGTGRTIATFGARFAALSPKPKRKQVSTTETKPEYLDWLKRQKESAGAS
jgi:phage replication O-like protein O